MNTKQEQDSSEHYLSTISQVQTKKRHSSISVLSRH
jgi:hypothetical protein